MIASLSWRSVKARKGRAVLNGLGIVLGVALFFSVLSLSKTIVSTFDELFSSVYGETDLIVGGSNMAGTVDQELLTKIKGLGGVEKVAATVSGVVARQQDGKKSGASDQLYLSGVDNADPDLSGSTLLRGSSSLSGNDVQLDETWAKAQNLKLGDSFKVATPTGLQTLKVSGIYRIGEGVEFGGQGFAAIELPLARKLLDIPRGYSEIQIAVTTGTNVEKLRDEIEQLAPEGTSINTPSDISDTINEQMAMLSMLLYFFAAMSLFVGGFLILNSFTMTIAQRLREIGMMRTLGASRKTVRRMILLEAVILGLLGSVIGILLGLLLTKLMVAMVSGIGMPIGKIQFPPSAFVIAPILGVLATVIGALRPAFRASRIPPIQAVLKEHRADKLLRGRRLGVGGACVLLGLAGVFTLASSTTGSTPVVLAGVVGIFLLFTGVIMIGPLIVPPLIQAMAWPLRKLTPIEGRLAGDNARSNPVRTASTASGLMIGIALVAAIGSLGSSMIGSISDELDEQMKTDFIVQPAGMQGGGPQQTIAGKAVKEIQSLPDARAVAGTRMIYLTDGPKGIAYVSGIEPLTREEFVVASFAGADAASVNRKLADGGATIDESTAKTNGYKVGETITLSGPRNTKKLKIVALQVGSVDASGAVTVSNDTFQEIYGIDGYNMIQVVARDGRAESLGREINTLLADQYPNFEALSNEEIKQQVKSQVNQVFSIFYVILAVAILVSLLGVINTLLMSVLERTREIGVLRAIGSGRWQVRRVIVSESLLITVSGALLGLIVGMILGYAFVRGISASGTDVAFHPPVGAIVMVAVLAVVFGVLAALLPARRAAKMNVIEAVSYE